MIEWRKYFRVKEVIRPETVLITGGAGFIGSNFVKYLIENSDVNVIILDALTYAGNIDNIAEYLQNKRVKFYHGNVCNSEMVNDLVSMSDYVVHFAAETHVARSIHSNRVFFETDVIGTQTICSAVGRNNVKRLIHISSSEVYGTCIGPSMDESHSISPHSPYAAAKVGADRLAWSYYKTYNLPVVIVRPFNNFGPRQHPEKMIPRFLMNIFNGENMEIHGDGRASRDWIYVMDTCRAIDLILKSKFDLSGLVFNVGTETSRSIKSIVHMICGMFNLISEDWVRYVDQRPGQVKCHRASIAFIHNFLGWRPIVSFSDGLNATSTWYKKNYEKLLGAHMLSKVPIRLANGKEVYQ